MIWKPHATVAAVVEMQGKFLLVEETTSDGIRLNQPAGHLEKGESLIAAVIRETDEETAYDFTPQYLLGTYHWRHPRKDTTYLRFAFIGQVSNHRPTQRLDRGILRTLWLSADEIRATRERHRSPQVMACVEHYLAGQRFPLDVITSL